MYRRTVLSELVVECSSVGGGPDEDACQPTAESPTAGDKLCTDGYSGVLCKVCLKEDNGTYVWDGDSCSLCDESHAGALYFLLGLCAVLVLMISAYVIWKRKEIEGAVEAKRQRKSADEWRDLIDELQTKYKIIIKLLQTMSKVTTLYPVAYPSVFTDIFHSFDFIKHIDINVLPIDCVYTTDFHSKLIMMTVLPVLFIGIVAVVYCTQRVRYQSESKDYRDMEARAVYVIVIFVYSVFPLVSTTIMQTFSYDTRLQCETGEAYLIADYSIEKSSDVHQKFVAYAVVMSIVFCAGVPVVSWYLIHKHSDDIFNLQKVQYEIHKLKKRDRRLKRKLLKVARRHSAAQLARGHEPHSPRGNSALEETLSFGPASKRIKKELEEKQAEARELFEKNHMLGGLSPLYREYEPEHRYFEIFQFVCTIFLVGIATSLPVASSSVVFLALMVSFTVLLSLSNTKPYIDFNDDILAQMAQISITLALCVGLLTLSNESTVETDSWSAGCGEYSLFTLLPQMGCENWQSIAFSFQDESSVEACQTLCQSTPGCQDFIFGRPESQFANSCSLLRSGCVQRTDLDYDLYDRSLNFDEEGGGTNVFAYILLVFTMISLAAPVLVVIFEVVNVFAPAKVEAIRGALNDNEFFETGCWAPIKKCRDAFSSPGEEDDADFEKTEISSQEGPPKRNGGSRIRGSFSDLRLPAAFSNSESSLSLPSIPRLFRSRTEGEGAESDHSSDQMHSRLPRRWWSVSKEKQASPDAPQVEMATVPKSFHVVGLKDDESAVVDAASI